MSTDDPFARRPGPARFLPLLAGILVAVVVAGVLFRGLRDREEPEVAPEAPPPAAGPREPPTPPPPETVPAETPPPVPDPEDPARVAAARAEKLLLERIEALRAISDSCPEPALRVLAAVLQGGAFRLADPPRTEEGMLAAVHARTGLPFVLLPGGEYTMGASDAETMRYAEVARPAHRVTVRPFLLARTECTRAAWAAGGGESKSEWNGPDLPVGNVSAVECEAWCAANGLRLPSEAEWEYACRAGRSTRHFHGDDAAGLQEHAWFADNAEGRLRPVAGRKPNAFSLFDMHGNAFEWCADTWQADYRDAPADGSPRRDESTRSRAYRGGSFRYGADGCASAFRSAWPATGRETDLSFRPAAGG